VKASERAATQISRFGTWRLTMILLPSSHSSSRMPSLSVQSRSVAESSSAGIERFADGGQRTIGGADEFALGNHGRVFPVRIEAMLRDFLARVHPRRRVAVRRHALAVVGIVAVGTASLAACGVKGPLKPPAAAATPPSADAPASAPATPAGRAPTSPLEPGPQPPSTAP
jgi:predicted small lipoprotein YifL